MESKIARATEKKTNNLPDRKEKDSVFGGRFG